MSDGAGGGPSVLVAREGGVALVTLNEPQSLNALSAGVQAGLQAAIPALLEDAAVRCIVLTGAGRAFCAGGDIRTMGERQALQVHGGLAALHRWLEPLMTAGKPVVTAINGVAAGGGLSLALMGDVIVASREARFRAAFSGLGVVADLGLALTLPRAIGFQRASDILLTNRWVDAEEAFAMGLVTRLAEPQALLDTALSVAAGLAAGPTIALGLTKQLMRKGCGLPAKDFLEVEAALQAVAFGTADFAEGVDAFLAKRKPVFSGR